MGKKPKIKQNLNMDPQYQQSNLLNDKFISNFNVTLDKNIEIHAYISDEASSTKFLEKLLNCNMSLNVRGRPSLRWLTANTVRLIKHIYDIHSAYKIGLEDIQYTDVSTRI